MSAQILSDRKARRIAASTGLTVVRGWGHGGYTFAFVTDDHRHGWWDSKSGEWGWEDPDRLVHYSSCSTLFPS